MNYKEDKEIILFGIDTEELTIPEVKLTFSNNEIVPIGKIRSSGDVANILRKIYPIDTIELQEQMIVLYLDQANNIKGYYRHSVGSINGTLADIRIILAGAIKSLSVSIIIAHNHPSGNLRPSEADIQLTKKFSEASKFMDIKLLDHLIITKNGFYSFADEGSLGLIGIKFKTEEDSKSEVKQERQNKESQHALNKRIESFMAEKLFKKDVQSFSKEEIAFIQQYEGSGGQGSKGASGEGILYEFYTPDYIVELMWELAFRNGYDGGTVLEPSIGIGRLIAPAKDYTKCVGFEINPLAKAIAEVSYPGSIIYHGYFESAFLEQPRFTKKLKDKITWLPEYPFSLVIGNPPYGIYKNKYSGYFTKPNFRQLETFFMYYGLLMLKKGGLLIYLTGSNFLRNGDTYNDSKKELEKISEFVDAYRLPPVFKSSKVPTDIIVLRRK